MRVLSLQIAAFALVACVESDGQIHLVVEDEPRLPLPIRVATTMAPEDYLHIYFEDEEWRLVHTIRCDHGYFDLPELYRDVPVSKPMLKKVALDLSVK